MHNQSRTESASVNRLPQHGQSGPRRGTILALFAVVVPVLLAVAGLVLDGSALLNEYRFAQHAADAAATAAAKVLRDGGDASEAIDTAERYVHEHNGLAAATVTVSIPPGSGLLAGDSRSVEVEVLQPAATHFLSFLGSDGTSEVRTRAVARYEASTAGAALVVLDPDPFPLAVPAVGALMPALPSLVGGLEILGTSQIRVDGAIHVNTIWGGFDEDGNPAGETAPPPYAIAAPVPLMAEQLRARDIRVVGGVDDPTRYGHFTAGDPSPLTANRLPVPDPLSSMPVPTTLTDPVNVASTNHGGVRIADIPLIDPPRTLQPGIYDYLQIVSGTVTFSPGIYIIRDVDPLTGIALNIAGGQVIADGVMFYITNSAGYSPASGLPDATDGETAPPPPGAPSLVPSTVIAVALPGSVYRGLSDPASPFDGVLIFQRRADRRPVVLINDILLGGTDFDGTIYAKWGHVVLNGSGFEQTRTVAGTLRLVNVAATLIAPTPLLPPAEDVFLVD